MPPTSSVPPISDTARVLGLRLRARREALDMSLEELGQAANVNWSMCGLIERGQRNPSLHVLMRMASGLNKDLSHFVKDLPAPPPPAPRKKGRRGGRSLS
jgi:transcriptional regulator with XRE-family HTH domain